MVDADIAAIEVAQLFRIRDVIVHQAGRLRIRIECHDSRRKWIEARGRDHVIGKPGAGVSSYTAVRDWHSRYGIENAVSGNASEVAQLLRGCRNSNDLRLPLLLAIAF